MSEPTLSDISQQLQELKAELKQESELIRQELTQIKQRLDTLDSRFFEFSMRIVSTNQTAFFGVAITVLSAAIAFVVARFSGGPLR